MESSKDNPRELSDIFIDPKGGFTAESGGGTLYCRDVRANEEEWKPIGKVTRIRLKLN